MIDLEHVSKSFRRAKVLDDLSLTIGTGDRVALVGSNGAGKTTLIRCILGQYAHKGTIMVAGRPPREARRHVLGKIGFVPQSAPPLKMPVGELVRFAAGIADIPADDIHEVAGRLDLDMAEIRNRPFVKLSGGQQQKVLVAIAIARKPDLIIMDEPTANLDPQARLTLFELLSERQDLPLLISSHRLEEVAGLVNRIVEMDRGRIVLDDKVADGGELSDRLPCSISLSRADKAFARTMNEWGFTAASDEKAWTGVVPGADRLRFFGVLARYSGIVDGLTMGGAQEEDRKHG